MLFSTSQTREILLLMYYDWNFDRGRCVRENVQKGHMARKIMLTVRQKSKRNEEKRVKIIHLIYKIMYHHDKNSQTGKSISTPSPISSTNMMYTFRRLVNTKTQITENQMWISIKFSSQDRSDFMLLCKMNCLISRASTEGEEQLTFLPRYDFLDSKIRTVLL